MMSPKCRQHPVGPVPCNNWATMHGPDHFRPPAALTVDDESLQQQ
jgi:hypothetical protein